MRQPSSSRPTMRASPSSVGTSCIPTPAMQGLSLRQRDTKTSHREPTTQSREEGGRQVWESPQRSLTMMTVHIRARELGLATPCLGPKTIVLEDCSSSCYEIIQGARKLWVYRVLDIKLFKNKILKVKPNFIE